MTALAGLWRLDRNPDAAEACDRMLAAQRIYGPISRRRYSHSPVISGLTNSGTAPFSSMMVCIAFAVGCFALIDVLPVVGIGIRPVGFIAILGFVGVAANSIWRYHLIELTPEYAAAQILATMKSAVIVIDLEAKIRVVNHAAAAMLGFAEGELAGKPVRTIMDPDETISTGHYF